MNNLKFKLGLLSLLAILAVSVFLTSCEQDSTAPLNEGYDINVETANFENFDINTHLEKNAKFSKTIDVQNSAEKKFGVSKLSIRIKSNDKRVLNEFDKNAIIFKYNTVDNNQPTEEHSDLNEESTVEIPKWNENTKLVQIEILGINHSDSYKGNEYMGYALEFSDGIKSYLKKNNVSLFIDFNPNNEQTKTNLKGNRSLHGDLATISASKRTRAWYYYANCNIDVGCPSSSPIHYHSYKYFYSSNPHTNLVWDDVAVCCLSDCLGKTLRRMYFNGGYVSAIYMNRDFCLDNGCNGSCYYG